MKWRLFKVDREWYCVPETEYDSFKEWSYNKILLDLELPRNELEELGINPDISFYHRIVDPENITFERPRLLHEHNN